MGRPRKQPEKAVSEEKEEPKEVVLYDFCENVHHVLESEHEDERVPQNYLKKGVMFKEGLMYLVFEKAGE